MSKSSVIAKNTLFLYVRMGLVLLVSLYTVRVVLEALGITEYGVYTAVGGVINSLSFVSAVLVNASQRFFSVELGQGENNQLKSVFSSIFVLYILVGLLLLAIFESVGLWFLNHKMIIPNESIEGANWVYQCVTISFIVTLIASPFQSLVIAHEKMNVYAVIGLVDVFLKLLITIIILYIKNNKLITYALLVLIESLICQIFYIIYCINNFKIGFIDLRLNKIIVRPIINYTKWSIMGAIAYVANTQGLNVIINIFFGPIVNAAYAIGNQVKNAVSLFGSNFFLAVRPAMIKEYTSKNIDYFKQLFFFSSKVIFIFLYIFSLPILLETPLIMSLWLKDINEGMIIFTRLMLIASIVLSLSEPITTTIQASGEVKKYHLYVDGFILLTLPLVYLGYKKGLPPSSAIVISIIILIVAHIIRLNVLKGVMKFKIQEYIKKLLMPIIVTIMVSYPIGYIISKTVNGNLIVTIMKCCLEGIIGIITSSFIILTLSERKKLIGMGISFLEKIKK